MLMLYFSGTGNSKLVAELFSKEMDATLHSIEENVDFISLINAHEVIGFCYPIYMSRVPRIMRNFVNQHTDNLKGKKLVILCTQWWLSGDGARAFADLLPQNHVDIIYGEHFFMPNNVNNVFILPISNNNKSYIPRTERKIQSVCKNIKHGIIKKRGFNLLSRALGLIQGLLIFKIEEKANHSVTVTDNCTNCQVCVSICPTNNLLSENGQIISNRDCTMCYRCINKCPKKAINVVFNGKIKEQYKGIQIKNET